MITVDTGISAVEETAYARELDFDLIITDHHEPGRFYPMRMQLFIKASGKYISI